MASQNPYFYAQTVLQQTLFDKDTGLALASGVVSYFSDPAFSIPKDVYEVSYTPSGGYVYADIGSTLTLSSIGTFIDGSGNNSIPILFPYTGTESAPGDFEPYYIQVHNSSSILQFTVAGWPLNDFNQAAISESSTASQNLLTNPQFSSILFPNASVILSLTGTVTTQVAPGWYLTTSGTGTVTLNQLSLSVDTPGNASYALQIASSVGFTSNLLLYQKIANSPRLASGDNIAAYVEGACPTPAAIPLIMSYQYSTDATSTSIFTQSTPNDGSYGALSGSVLISESPSSANASGYLDLILSIPAGTTVSLTNFQLTIIPALVDSVTYIQTSAQQQQSDLAWYYDPQLSFKPIKSWATGWNFPFNPCQPLGINSSTGGLPLTTGGTDNAFYLLDQTILFQSVDTSINFSNSISTGLTISSVAASPTQFALIQYLDQTSAIDILSSRIAAMLGGYASVAITGQINLYWTTNGSLPNCTPSVPNYNSVVVSLSGGVPTVASGWTKVPSAYVQSFTLGTSYSTFNFNLWDATSVDTSAATYFAIVVSFNTLGTSGVSQSVTLDYVTLCSGDIATVPEPTTFDEQYNLLQYYYETSYPYGYGVGASIAVGAATALNSIVYPLGVINSSSGTTLNFIAPSFQLDFKNIKRTSPNFYAYNVSAAFTSGSGVAPYQVSSFSVICRGGVSPFTSVTTQSTAGLLNSSFYGYTPAVNNILFTTVNLANQPLTTTGSNIRGEVYYQFQYVSDARLGVT